MRLLALILMLVSVGVQAASPSAVISVGGSRTSGVAPLCIQFDGSGSTDTDLAGTGTDTAFHKLSYLWSFGDSSAGTFTNGIFSGHSKNFSSDPITGKCFTASATVTLVVSDGTTSSEATQAITVTAADTQWATGKTTCVSSSGSFTDCPTVLNGDYADVAACQTASKCLTQSTVPAITSDMRLVFKAGETFTGQVTIEAADTGPGYVGSYGSGRATISRSGAGAPCFSVAADDWRIVDLICSGNGSTSDNAMQLVNGGTKNTIKNVKFTGWGASSYNIVEYSGTSSGVDFSFVENEFSSNNASAGGVNMFIYGTRAVVMDNLFSGDDTQFQNLRTYFYNSVINGNTFTYGGKSGSPTESLAIRSPDAGTNSSKVVVSGNKITLGPSYTGTGIKVSLSTGETGAVEHTLIQRNYIDSAGSGTGRECMKVGGNYITVRNNICDMSGGVTWGVVYSSVDGGPAGTDSTYLESINNTFFSSTDVGATFAAILVQSSTAPTSSSAVNNLAYSPLPSGTTTRYMVNGTIATESTNSTPSSGTNEIMAGDGTTGTPVTPFSNSSGNMNTPVDYALKSTSYAKDGGTASYPATSFDFLGCYDPSNTRYGAVVNRAAAICISGSQ